MAVTGLLHLKMRVAKRSGTENFLTIARIYCEWLLLHLDRYLDFGIFTELDNLFVKMLSKVEPWFTERLIKVVNGVEKKDTLIEAKVAS